MKTCLLKQLGFLSPLINVSRVAVVGLLLASATVHAAGTAAEALQMKEAKAQPLGDVKSKGSSVASDAEAKANEKEKAPFEPLMAKLKSYEELQALDVTSRGVYLYGIQKMLVEMNKADIKAGVEFSARFDSGKGSAWDALAILFGEKSWAEVQKRTCIYAGYVQLLDLNDKTCPRPPACQGRPGYVQCNSLVFGSGVCTQPQQRASEDCQRNAKPAQDIWKEIQSRKGEWDSLKGDVDTLCQRPQKDDTCALVQSYLGNLAKVGASPAAPAVQTARAPAVPAPGGTTTVVRNAGAPVHRTAGVPVGQPPRASDVRQRPPGVSAPVTTVVPVGGRPPVARPPAGVPQGVLPPPVTRPSAVLRDGEPLREGEGQSWTSPQEKVRATKRYCDPLQLIQGVEIPYEFPDKDTSDKMPLLELAEAQQLYCEREPINEPLIERRYERLTQLLARVQRSQGRWTDYYKWNYSDLKNNFEVCLREARQKRAAGSPAVRGQRGTVSFIDSSGQMSVVNNRTGLSMGTRNYYLEGAMRELELDLCDVSNQAIPIRDSAPPVPRAMQIYRPGRNPPAPRGQPSQPNDYGLPSHDSRTSQ